MIMKARLYDPRLDMFIAEMREAFEPFKAMFEQPVAITTQQDALRVREVVRQSAISMARPTAANAEERIIAGPAGDLRLRIIAPPRTPRCIAIDVHGGAFYMGEPAQNDGFNARLAAELSAVTVSVDYRLAPENPYPAGVDDCEAAILWVLRNARREWGVERLILLGQSAGSTLAVAALLRLRDKGLAEFFIGASLYYGTYDLTGTPSQIAQDRVAVREIYLHPVPPAERKKPDISPLYGDLKSLPPALFTVGTEDYVFDDSLFMHMRWIAAGNESELAIYPGCGHAFNLIPATLGQMADDRAVAWIAERIAGAG